MQSGEAATFIPHSRKVFIQNQWTEPPHGLTLQERSLAMDHSQYLTSMGITLCRRKPDHDRNW